MATATWTKSHHLHELRFSREEIEGKWQQPAVPALPALPALPAVPAMLAEPAVPAAPIYLPVPCLLTGSLDLKL